MKVLVTGVAGFAGSHLTDFLLKKKKVVVYGIDRRGVSSMNIEDAKNKIRYYECDITNYSKLHGLLGRIRPDSIIHLAAQSSPLISKRSPAETLEANAIGQTNLLEAVRNLKIDPKIIIAGSCQEYGIVRKNEIPIKETHALKPLNIYSVSKVTQDLLGYHYYKSYGLKIIRTRPSHHTGPRRPDNFVCSNFAKQIAMVEAKKQKPIICVGNLHAIRDFTDVRDIVRAYWLLMQKGSSGEAYNICSGKGHSIKEVLDILLSLSKAKIKVRKDLARMRPNDIQIFVGDCTKIKRQVGWKSIIPLKQTLEDLLNYWRKIYE